MTLISVLESFLEMLDMPLRDELLFPKRFSQLLMFHDEATSVRTAVL
jgi:hypothetical protein